MKDIEDNFVEEKESIEVDNKFGFGIDKCLKKKVVKIVKMGVKIVKEFK